MHCQRLQGTQALQTFALLDLLSAAPILLAAHTKFVAGCQAADDLERLHTDTKASGCSIVSQAAHESPSIERMVLAKDCLITEPSRVASAERRTLAEFPE